jgi:hypothetical protein
VSIVAILLPLRIFQVQGVRKEPRTTVALKQNIREEVTAISPQHAATSDAELSETLGGMC